MASSWAKMALATGRHRNNRLARAIDRIAEKEASMVSEMPSESAERVHLQWNEGWETWQEVSPQYAGEPGVVTFIRATTHQRTLEALEQVLDDSRHGLTMAPATRALALYAYAQSGGTDPDILAGLDAATAMLTEIGHFGSSAALTRIKEAP